MSNAKTFQVTIYSPEDGEEHIHQADSVTQVIRSAATLLTSMEVGAYVTFERTE